jgi:hypothetical protein
MKFSFFSCYNNIIAIIVNNNQIFIFVYIKEEQNVF